MNVPFLNSITQFLKDVRFELSKIIWPKSDELIGSIIVVLIIVVAFSIFLGLVDFTFYRLAQQIF